MKKVLASDFDDTLYFEKGDTSYRTDDIKAIMRFREQGHLFGVCSGRPLTGITDFMIPEFDFDFYVASSGACILDGDLNIIKEYTIPFSIIKTVVDEYAYPAVLHTSQGAYTNVKPEKELPVKINIVDDIESIRDMPIYSFSIRFYDGQKAREALAILNKLPGIHGFLNRTDLDFVPLGCSKINGLHIIQNHYQIATEDFNCIGDSYNDLPMLSSDYQSFSFDYSPQEVQDQSDHIVSHLDQAIDFILNQ